APSRQREARILVGHASTASAIAWMGGKASGIAAAVAHRQAGTSEKRALKTCCIGRSSKRCAVSDSCCRLCGHLIMLRQRTARRWPARERSGTCGKVKEEPA